MLPLPIFVLIYLNTSQHQIGFEYLEKHKSNSATSPFSAAMCVILLQLHWLLTNRLRMVPAVGYEVDNIFFPAICLCSICDKTSTAHQVRRWPPVVFEFERHPQITSRIFRKGREKTNDKIRSKCKYGRALTTGNPECWEVASLFHTTSKGKQWLCWKSW